VTQLVVSTQKVSLPAGGVATEPQDPPRLPLRRRECGIGYPSATNLCGEANPGKW
jgi:hypothetical protein